MNLAFLDTETTGLPERGAYALLEVGIVIVSLPTFEIVAEKEVVLPFKRTQPSATSLVIDERVQEMHRVNGLWRDCENSKVTSTYDAEQDLIKFVLLHGCQGSPIAGANPSFDREVLKAKMPDLLKLFHYRSFETNSFWLFQEFLLGKEGTKEKFATNHRAIDDCKAAIQTVEQHFNFMEALVKS